MGQGQRIVIIDTNFVDFESQEVNAKFQDHGSGSEVEDFENY